MHGVGSTAVPENRTDVVGIRHASFTWSIDSTATSRTLGGTPKRHFVLTVDDELLFQSGKINLIVGPTGSGKTSLLMALLGELYGPRHRNDHMLIANVCLRRGAALHPVRPGLVHESSERERCRVRCAGVLGAE